MEPQIQYAKTSDGVNIAYYAIGTGPPLIWMSGNIGVSIEDEWKIPSDQRLIAASARVLTCVRFDLRGSGLSDRNVDEFSLSAMMRDLEAVADRAATGSFALLAPGESVGVAVAYAATHPERVSHLVLWVLSQAANVELQDGLFRVARTDWKLATESWMAAMAAYSSPDDARNYAAMMRRAVTAETFIRYMTESRAWDVNEFAARVRAPTLIVHPGDNPYFPADYAKSLAAAIPGARLALTEGTGLVPGRQVLATISEFLSDLTGFTPRPAAVPTRPQPAETTSGTAIILFADIADSTRLTENMGDAAFREKAREVDGALRGVIRDHDGIPIEGKLLGDGVLAVFTSARQAIEAALACGEAGNREGLPLHLGLHASDVIREDHNVYGGAVNIASRISALSAPGEVLVSDIVRGLARTSAGVQFEDRGEQALKGVGEKVRVWRVVAQEPRTENPGPREA